MMLTGCVPLLVSSLVGICQSSLHRTKSLSREGRGLNCEMKLAHNDGKSRQIESWLDHFQFLRRVSRTSLFTETSTVLPVLVVSLLAPELCKKLSCAAKLRSISYGVELKNVSENNISTVGT